MTLQDLWKLIGHYKRLCIVLPLVFALAGAGFAILRSVGAAYTANSYIVAASAAQLTTLNGTAASAAREYAAANPGYAASAKAEASSLTITISASGPDSDGVAAAANAIATSAVEGAEGLLGKDGVKAQIEQAYSSVRSSGGSILSTVLIALFAGLFAAICLVIAIDAIKQPVKGASDLSDSSGFAVLGELPGDTGERLLANVRFASGKPNMSSVLVVPASEGEPAALVGMLLDRAARSEFPRDGSSSRGQQVRVSACAPLLQGAAAAYESREVDAVVIAAAQWDDSRKNVESTANELRLANANVVGCVLVKGVKGAKRTGVRAR